MMKQQLVKAYLKLPPLVQNVLVSLYGIKLYVERYGVGRRAAEKMLKNSESYSFSEMERLQEDAFVDLAHYAIDNVPFYIEWAKNKGISKSNISSIDDLSLFPVIEKEMIRDSPSSFVSKKYRNKKLISLSTSGSTGSPLEIYTDNHTRTLHYAFFTRLRSWFGVEKRGGRATFLGRIVVPQGQKRPPFWRYDFGQNNLLMSTYHLSEDNLSSYIEKLTAYRPVEIFGHPSSIYRVANYIIDNDSCGKVKPNVVITTAETLMPYQRTAIEKAFDCPVVDQYGCTEMAFFASQCESGEMHFHPEHAIIEIVDSKNCIVKPGVRGQLVATSLISKVMPLIRYKVGDTLSVSEEKSKCHPGFPIIKFLEGRTDDLVYKKDGGSVGRLSPIFRSDKNVTLSQITQEESGDITVLVVPNEKYNDKNREMIRRELVERVGDDLNISIFEVESIPKEKNGKFRPVKSYYKRIVD
ncbi:hypothetical protein KUV44_00265 [Marinobacter daepoensis]|uniref:Phenylacetate--CoA ligase family protein n=1 Tax=Marinobacter daepoensis TaxID=262077 RepID=A0ABS3BAN4_9GAMM|nr:phenylacetate--CoA ligase family protein [Marinobacter daepoensis]MBN7768878.1 phenylacetate--CoA ligase family protein [Marinobacter daepoensis]MBY6077568.1 hypothetical protein [Marinobacter daepoensis]